MDATSGVIANDSDIDGDPITAAIATGPAHGTLSFTADGSFTYTPGEDYNGPDSFTYTVTDGPSTSDPATVTINVAPVNDAPGAGWNTYWLDEDTTLATTTVDGVLANDFDIDGDSFTLTQLSSPANGTLVLNALDGTFQYTPNANFVGNDQFTYKINDGLLDSNLARVTFVVQNVNDAPVASPDAYTTNQGRPLTVVASGLLANDSDVDGDALTATLDTAPANGSVTINTDGSFTYSPADGFSGSDSFTYVANDAAVDSSPATVTITVAPVINNLPVANADTATTNQETPVTINVLANDTDADGDSLTAVIASPPTGGTVFINADNTIQYTPALGFSGSDSFTYVADDGADQSTAATVTITVTRDAAHHG